MVVPGSSFRENELKKKETSVSEASPFPFKSPLLLLPTLFSPLYSSSGLSTQVKITSFGGVIFKFKGNEESSKRGEFGEVMLQNFRAGNNLTNIPMQLCYLGLI